MNAVGPVVVLAAADLYACKGKAGISVTRTCFGLKGVIKEICYHTTKVNHFNLK